MADISVAVAASILCGVLVGLLLAVLTLKSKISKDFVKEKQQFAKEKAQLADDMSEQLHKIRDSLVQSIEAYESTVELVEKTLPTNSEKYRELVAPLQPKKIEHHRIDEKESTSSKWPQQLPLEVKNEASKKEPSIETILKAKTEANLESFQNTSKNGPANPNH